MTEVNAAIEVATDAASTWDAAVDWEGQHHWVLGSSVRPVLRGGRGVGATLVARTGYGPLAITDPMEITEWDPPRTVTLQHTGRLVTGSATYRVEAVGPDRAKLTWSEELTAPHPALRPLYALGVPLFATLIRFSSAASPAGPPTRG